MTASIRKKIHASGGPLRQKVRMHGAGEPWGRQSAWKILKVLVGSRWLEEGHAEVGTNCSHLEFVASWLAGWLAGCQRCIWDTKMLRSIDVCDP